MDIVIPLGTGSRVKNFELRICLRTIEKYLAGYRNIWIIGERPEWLRGINHIPAGDPHRVPDWNIMEKITLACQCPEITDSFLFMNDDHYLLSPFDAPTFPYFCRENLDEYVKKRGLDSYGRRADNTLRHLLSRNLPIKHYDVHTPIVYNKILFQQHVTSADWKGTPNGFIIKSLYANSEKIEGEYYKDNKSNRAPLPGERIFSSTPHLSAAVTRALRELFPQKSKYEKSDI